MSGTRSRPSLAARVKLAVKGTLLPVLRLGDRWTGRQRGTVLVLAHMRSGSTLLQHLLLSDPTLWGRGERNRRYASVDDLDRLVVDVCAFHRRLPRVRDRFVDQINHDPLVASEDVLAHPRVRRIFLIREPIGALGSMIHVLGKHYAWTPEQCLDYYVARLGTLERYARQAPRGTQMGLTYGELVGTERHDVLGRLSRFLDLEDELGDAYPIFSFTGRSGDPGATIRGGRIAPRDAPRPIELTKEQVGQAQEAFRRCRDTLAECCVSGPDLPNQDAVGIEKANHPVALEALVRLHSSSGTTRR